MQQSQTGFNTTLMLRNRAIETEFDPPDKFRFIGIVFPPFAGGLKKLGFFLCFALFPPGLVGAGLSRCLGDVSGFQPYRTSLRNYRINIFRTYAAGS